MGFLDRRYQNVVYWPIILKDGFPVAGPIGTPFELIKARWQDLHEKFIDLEGRDDVSRAVIYTKPQLNLGGFVMLVDSAEDPAIGPQFVQEYPPLVPYTLTGFLEYWNFNNTLDGENGNDFVINSGSLGFTAGVVESAISSDGDSGFTIDSESDLSINGLEEFTIALWIKSNITVLDLCSVNIVIPSNLDLTIEIGQVNQVSFGDVSFSDISQVTPPDGWAEDYTSVIAVWKKGVRQDIYINGTKQDVFTSSIYDTILADNLLSVNVSITGEDVDIDELRLYGSAIAEKDIQTIAAVHPSQYKNAFEVRQTGFSPNIRGTKRIYKQWLKSKE